MNRRFGAVMLLGSAGLVLSCEEKQPSKPAPAAAAGTGARTPAPDAADIYRRCWPVLTDELSLAAAETRFTPQGASVAEDSSAGSWEQVREQLRGAAPTVADLMKAAAMTRCDFGLPEAGRTLKPQDMGPVMQFCGDLRHSAQLLRADAARCWGESDADGAVDRIAAIYGMAAQGSGSPFLIVALVDSAIIMLANDAARMMAEGAPARQLSGEQKRRLRAALDRLDAADPDGSMRARKAEAPDAAVAAKLDAARARLMQDLARTRQALGPP